MALALAILLANLYGHLKGQQTVEYTGTYRPIPHHMFVGLLPRLHSIHLCNQRQATHRSPKGHGIG